MAADRWEHGSIFHLSLETGATDEPWREHPHRLYGSGRDALRALALWGVAEGRWRRLVVPSYYCQDVLEPLRDEMTISAYPHAPTLPAVSPLTALPNDLTMVAGLFGADLEPPVGSTGPVIEDHTHDPLGRAAWDSGAAYAFASLRKTLPLPDGGVLWSPRGLDLPPPVSVTGDHDRSTHQRLAAMVLKRHYLAGDDVTKDEFRALAEESERTFGTGEISGMSPYSCARLPTFPAAEWRQARERNRRAFRDALGTVSGVTVLDVPFAATLLFDSSTHRDQVRSQLVRSRVYATVYWPLDQMGLDGIPEAHVDLSRRILSIHCDQRYTIADMVRVADLFREAAIRS